MKEVKCPVCKVNPPSIVNGKYVAPCVVCRCAIDTASGKPWVAISGFKLHPAMAKKAGLVDKDGNIIES